MANYLFYENTDKGIINRFAALPEDDVSGIEIWKKYTSILVEYLNAEEREKANLEKDILNDIERSLRTETYERFKPDNIRNFFYGQTEKHILIQLLQELRSIKLNPNRCPRLFISHRSVDWVYALSMGQIAAENKFDYWIDILDDKLKSLTNNTNLSEECRVILTACIIEMAIINCTHVITCITPDTKGSQWVPYEYGRITEIPSHYKKAASWVHPNLKRMDFPDYMHLGEVVFTKHKIGNWLNSEYVFWSGSTCPVSQDLLKDIALPPLPENEEDCVDEPNGFPYYLYIIKSGQLQEKLITDRKLEQDSLNEILNKTIISGIEKIEKMSEEKHRKKELEQYIQSGIRTTRPIKGFPITSFKKRPHD